MYIGVEATADGLDRQDNMADEELASVDDLVYSDEELFYKYTIFCIKLLAS